MTDLPENIKSSIQTFLKASTDSEISESGVKIGSPERVWGPKNDIQGVGCCSGPGGEGPCRMLQCECLESEETEDNGAYDYKGEITWFQGRCDSCKEIYFGYFSCIEISKPSWWLERMLLFFRMFESRPSAQSYEGRKYFIGYYESQY